MNVGHERPVDARRPARWGAGLLRERPVARRAGIAVLVLSIAGLAVPACVRVQISYRDVGADARDAPGIDAPAPDAPSVPMDAPRPDVPAMDAPLSDTPLAVGPDATRSVLAAVGELVILASLRDFEAAVAALEAATNAAHTSGSAADRDAARAAWRAAMAIWQRIEAVQLGPAGLSLYTAGGRGLRDEIYAWPLVSRCRMDQDTVSGVHADAALLRAEAVSARGLAAIEYLLFYEPLDNGCGPTAAINTSGAWAALGDAEIARRRLVYAHTAAALVAERARELRLAWDPAGENFLGTLSTAGAGSSVFPTAQAGLNSLSDALFYLYKEVTDLKVGIPAGLYVDCPTATCPDHVESPWADASLDHVRANLEAFRDAYLGAPPGIDAPGFDDLLRSIGAGDLDARIQAAIVAALSAIDPVLVPLERAVDDDHPDVAALHAALRALADLFKVEALTLLDLELPNRLEGDND